jgi:arabinogalactan oligomer/maltooligosaccharide transport system substrate-binding protein
MNKKVWSIISLLLVGVMLLAACGGAAETTAPEPTEAVTEEKAADQPTEAPEKMGVSGTVSFWHSLKEGEIEGMNKAIAEFQAANPDVTFDVLFVPFEELRGKYETAVATGEGPCVLIGAADWGPSLYNAELVADVSQLASLEFLQGINQAALASVRYKDAIVGLPLGLKGVVLYRNASIVPDAPTSFDDLVAKAQAATSGDVVGANLERGPFFAFGHLNALGGALMTPDGDPQFNDENGVAWLEEINRFTEAGPAEFYTDNDVNLFKAGKAGMIIDGTWNLNDLAAAIGEDNLKIDTWPTGMSGYVQNDNIYLSPNTTGDDQAACWAFMEHVLNPDTQAVIAENNTGFIPAALGVTVADRLRSEAVSAFEKGVAFPVIPEMGAFWGPMETAMKSVFDESGDPVFALAQAENSVNAAIAEIRGSVAPAPEVLGTVQLWHSLKEGEIEGMNAAIEAFQAKNPGIQFDMLFVPFEELRGKYETAVATGEGPGLLVGAADWGPSLFDAELVTDVSPFASTAFLSSINQAALGSTQYNDALVGLPLGIKGVVLYRNASIVPEAPTSFDDLVAKAQAATSGDVVGANLERGPFFSFAHMNPNGGNLMTPEGDPLFNDENGVAWLNLLNRFTEAGPAEFYTDNDVNLFKAGKAGMIIDGTWNLNDLAAAIGEDNLKVDIWPSDMSGYVQTDNIYMGANVEGNDQAATWAFMKFLLSPEGQKLLADNNKGYIPSVGGVEVADRLRQEAIAAFADGVAFPVIPEMGAYWGPMETAMKTVFDQGGDAAAALQQAYDDVVAKLVEIRGGG